MQPLTATTNPPDDIEAVLGRFQAWSATRKPAGRIPSRSSDLPEGVRELSYEEALESSRYRWRTRVQPAESKVQDAASNETTATCIAPAEDSFDDQVPSDKLSLASTAPVPETRNSPETITPTFNTALAEALSIEPDPTALALVWPAPPRNERQVSMSLRVAASEQALIKARAAEAGLSVSAYLRQCALEVEKLRAQVHHTLALLQEGPERSLTAGQPQTPATTASFFNRLRQRIFGSPARLTLRA